jgi:hypothetical protein
VCGAHGGHRCNADGNHLSRYAAAMRDSLITLAELDLACAAAEAQAPSLTSLVRADAGSDAAD